MHSASETDPVVLILGSNQGNRNDFFIKAKSLIISKIGRILSESAQYETAAWGYEDQATYLNQVLIIKTMLTPMQLLTGILAIEKVLGRHRTEKWSPRTIDIDILFYGNQIIDKEELIIPHPRIKDRKFVLIPLVELIPEYIHPVFNLSVRQLNDQCTDQLKVSKCIES